MIPIESYKPKSANETTILEIYHRLVEAWNNRDARGFAHLFSGTALFIGFDGSHMLGRAQVEEELQQVFTEHSTGTIIPKVRDIHQLDTHCLLLSAVAGTTNGDNSHIDPSKNALQTLVVAKSDLGWLIELFQHTPASFHRRPESSQELTIELNELLIKAL